MENIKIRTDCQKNRYVLLEAVRYKKIVVPAGYVFDGLTKGFNKYLPRGLRGAAVHDFNCDKKIVSRRRGDKYAKEIWKEDGCSKWQIRSWYTGIRFYAMITFKK